jgi:hypothetical protein
MVKLDTASTIPPLFDIHSTLWMPNAASNMGAQEIFVRCNATESTPVCSQNAGRRHLVCAKKRPSPF